MKARLNLSIAIPLLMGQKIMQNNSRTNHVTFVCAQVLLGVSAQAAMNAAVFSTNQIPTKMPA